MQPLRKDQLTQPPHFTPIPTPSEGLRPTGQETLSCEGRRDDPNRMCWSHCIHNQEGEREREREKNADASLAPSARPQPMAMLATQD